LRAEPRFQTFLLRYINRKGIESKEAFDDGSLTLYEECGGDIEALFARFLSTKPTEEMVDQEVSVITSDPGWIPSKNEAAAIQQKTTKHRQDIYLDSERTT
jgi:hypothetical protein